MSGAPEASAADAGRPRAVVAGLLAVDIHPGLPPNTTLGALQPGHLLRLDARSSHVGIGGVVAVAMVMAKLALVRAAAAACVGADALGRLARDRLEHQGVDAGGLVEMPDLPTSFTVVLSPPGVDRMFLHLEGANAAFAAAHVPAERLARTQLLHFGYPTLLTVFAGPAGQAELCALLLRARAAGVRTSLDLSLPDPQAPGASVDWRARLAAALPLVDLFEPSWEELLMVLRPAAVAQVDTLVSPALLAELGDELIALGCPVALIKLGERGCYLRTAQPTFLPHNWHNRELFAPARLPAAVCSTCGAGDAAIAGFLSAVLTGCSPCDALVMATATGAAAVEGPDSDSTVPAWTELAERVAAGWPLHPTAAAFAPWPALSGHAAVLASARDQISLIQKEK